MGDIISEKKFNEIKAKYLDKPCLGDVAMGEIREIYSSSKYSKEIIERLCIEITNYRKDIKELCNKLAEALFL